MQSNNTNNQNFTGQLNRTYPQKRAADSQYDNRTVRSDPSYMQQTAYGNQNQQFKQQVQTNTYDPNVTLVSSNTTGYYDNNPSYPDYQQQSPYPASYDLVSTNMDGSYQQRHHPISSNPANSTMQNSVVQSSGSFVAEDCKASIYSQGGANSGGMSLPPLHSTPNSQSYYGNVSIQNTHSQYPINKKQRKMLGGHLFNSPVITDDELLKLSTRELNTKLQFYSAEEKDMYKLKRRTLKNRKYAKTSRNKFATELEETKNKAKELKNERDTLVKILKNLEQKGVSLDAYKKETAFLDELLQ